MPQNKEEEDVEMMDISRDNVKKELDSDDVNVSDSDTEKLRKNNLRYGSDAMHLAQQMKREEELSSKDKTILFNLHVQLNHDVLIQHQIETRAGSHMPTREQIERFKSIAPLKIGTYDIKEDKIIVRNWKQFCKQHNWDVTNPNPFLQLRNDKRTIMHDIKERRKFVQFLSNGLGNRTLYSVYHRFRNLYTENLQRRYKPEEDQMIIDHLENNLNLDERRKYSDLAKVLRRTRNSIWRRYKILKNKRKKILDLV